MLGQQLEANVPGDPGCLITAWKWGSQVLLSRSASVTLGRNLRVSREVKLGKEGQEGSLEIGRGDVIQENEARAWHLPIQNSSA